MVVQSSTKKWMFIGGGVIAAAALVVFFQNYPPQPQDASGAIGAAKRYQEPQISGADVKVSQDELTTWIQSDTFDRIVKDPQARKLFTDAAVIHRLEARDNVRFAIDSAASLAPDSDGMVGRLIAPENLRGTQRVLVTIDAGFAHRIEAGLDPASAMTFRLLKDSTSPDAVKLVVTGDAARAMHFALSSAKVTGDGMKLSFDPNTLRSLKVAIDEARFVDLATKNNAAIRFMFDNTQFLEAAGDNLRLVEGLVAHAHRLNQEVDPN